MNDDLEELSKANRDIRNANFNKKPINAKKIYKLGEIINNDVKYFGQDKTVNKHRTCMCICPECGELWRVALSAIVGGHIKGCLCQNGKKKV